MKPRALDPEVRIELLSPWVARVEVTRSTEEFGLYEAPTDPTSPGTRILHLGYREAPLHRVVRPDSPTAAWDIHPLPGGRPIGALERFDSCIEPSYLDWFVESGDLRGLEIPWLLPPGRYFIVQSSRPAHPVRQALFGNEVVSTPHHVHQLRGQKTFYSAILGADRRYPPVIDQPLIGLAMPHCSDEYQLHGVLFFSFTLPRQLQREFHLRPGLVLVVPAEGALVLDSNQAQARDEVRSRQEWAETLAPRFVDWCAGMSER